MCKNSDTPCPDCPRTKAKEAVWMFLTPEERRAIEQAQTRAKPTLQAQP